MDLAELLLKYDIYKQVAIIVDLCTLGINICVLLVLLSQRKYVDKKVRNSFIVYICFIVFMLLVEMGCWCTVFKSEYFTLYKVLTTIDYISLWIVPIVTFRLVIYITNDKVRFRSSFRSVLFLLLLIGGLLLLIPPFRDQIIVFDEELCGYNSGPLSGYYFTALSIIVLTGIIAGVSKVNVVGIFDTIVFALFMVGPLAVTMLNKWWASSVSLALMGFLLIILICVTYQKRLARSRQLEEEKHIELAETKSKLLLNQIQPHFLYNTLTTLKFLCETDPEKASTLCDDFAHYLRANIDAVNDDGLVPFDKELENIENYLHIEQARFGKRVKYILDIQIHDFLIPVLSIQTIVENSVKKGICKKNKGGTIKVSTLDIGDYIQIKVEDDGIGFDLNNYLNDGKMHTGLSNTRTRLELIGGSINVESEINVGTTVTVLIKKEENI